MKKVIIEDEKAAVEYIESVLNEWDSWKSHHIYLVQALQMLLKINKFKTEALSLMCKMANDMSAYSDALYKHIEIPERSERK